MPAASKKVKDPQNTVWGFIAEKIIIPVVVAVITTGGAIWAVKYSTSLSIAPTPTEVIPTLTSTPVPTPIPLTTPDIGNTGFAPVILNIQPRMSQDYGDGSGNFIIGFDIYYSDLDGDAALISYQVTSSPIAGLVIPDDAITSTSAMQIAGTIEAIGGGDCQFSWKTLLTGYTVMASATIVDKAGNKSNSYPYQYGCSGWN